MDNFTNNEKIYYDVGEVLEAQTASTDFGK